MLRGSLTVAVVGGIPVRVHWTFAVLLAWIFASGSIHGGTVAKGLTSAAFTCAVFLCVVLHELGHALAAKRFGVRTNDITLLPIGGVAALERIPEKPRQELVIAIAGPAVNIVIAAALFAGLMWREGVTALLNVDRPGFHVDHFLAGLAAVNVWLVAFNMIPAFPMDGGRVLRALLATALGYAPATRWAAAIGRGLAVVMALAGLFISPMLVLVALFVWISAAGELYDTERRTLLAGVPVSAAALKRFLVLSPDDTPDVAAAAAISGSQHDFPVTMAGRPDQQVIGVLGHCELLSMLARRGITVGDAMHRTFSAITETDSLAKAIEQMQSDRCSALPVMRDDRVVGLLTSASVTEFLALRAAGANLQSA